MGAGQSARKLTINNVEEVDVIKVSNSVVQRLTQKANTEMQNEVRPTTLTQSSPNKVTPQSPHSGDIPASSGYPVYYHPQLTLTALEIQQQKERELLNQDLYWQQRIENLEQSHLKINDIMDGEYKKAAEELYMNGQKKVNVQDIVQPCMENTDKVLKCYQEYPNQILKCGSLVEEFSTCVDQRRAHVIAARC
ncbi:coiled-coil-helix-coiled-coil-helix domain containing 3 [Andrena cerasifolii]|uniref:coiled-coil-helix-coiled-coil-helix domain containing 3 n=1 Tax=Andrena cerasifolii TaxID=2819439 RepID=UPI004037B3CB